MSNPNGVVSSRVVVATPGTPVKINVPSNGRADIQALPTNTGTVAVGGSNVLASGTVMGMQLKAGDPYSIETHRFDGLYLDAAVAGEGILLNSFAEK